MTVPQIVTGLYVPSCLEKEGHAQPLATALPLDMGKHLCLQHFLKQIRTLQQRLPREQRGEIPSSLLDSIQLQWKELPSGDFEGHPQGCSAPALASIAGFSYKLHPSGAMPGS